MNIIRYSKGFLVGWFARWTCKSSGQNSTDSWSRQGEELFQFFRVNICADSSMPLAFVCKQALWSLRTFKIQCRPFDNNNNKRGGANGRRYRNTQKTLNNSRTIRMMIVTTPKLNGRRKTASRLTPRLNTLTTSDSQRTQITKRTSIIAVLVTASLPPQTCTFLSRLLLANSILESRPW